MISALKGLNLTVLLSLVQAGGLAGPSITAAVTNGSAAATLLAPTNAALNAALAVIPPAYLKPDTPYNSSTAVQAIIMYHILPQPHVTGEIPLGHPTSTPTLLPGHNVSISENSTAGPFYIQGEISLNGTAKPTPAKLTITNVKAGNSYIQVIDAVLIPNFNLPAASPSPSVSPSSPAPSPSPTASPSSPSGGPTYPDIFTAVKALGLTLLEAYIAPGGTAGPSISAIATNGSVATTLFAPSDAAMKALLAKLPDGVSLDPSTSVGSNPLVEALIQYHFLPVAHTTKDIPATPTSVPTLLSDEGVTVSETSPAGPFFVTGNGFLPPDSSAPHVQIVTANIQAGNSYIQVIDSVLLPDISVLIGLLTGAGRR